MILHVEKTLKTTIQRKLPKSQKFARKYLWRSFVIYFVQTIFLRFTVILFHSNLDEKITSNEQKVTNYKQKVTSHKQKVVTSKEQKVTSREQKVMSNEQKVQPRFLLCYNHREKLVLYWIQYKNNWNTRLAATGLEPTTT